MDYIIDTKLMFFISPKNQAEKEKALIFSMFDISIDQMKIIDCPSLESMRQKIKKIGMSPKAVMAVIESQEELEKFNSLNGKWRQTYCLAVLTNNDLQIMPGLDTVCLFLRSSNNLIRSQFLHCIKDG